MNTHPDDTATLPEAMTVLDDVVTMLDTVVGVLHVHRDTTYREDDNEREALAFAADLLAQAWASARRARQGLEDDMPNALTMPDARMTDDVLAQIDAALRETPRWSVRREQWPAEVGWQLGPWCVRNRAGDLLVLSCDQGAAIDTAYQLDAAGFGL